MQISKLQSYYKSRRQNLQKNHSDSVFIIPSATETIRNGNVTFPFRQESSFYYLTGFEEPDAILVLYPQMGQYKSCLFVRKKDAEREMWEGFRHGVEGALQFFEMDEAYPIEEFDSRLPQFFKNAEKLYYHLGTNKAFDDRVLEGLNQFKKSLGRNGRGTLPIFDSAQAIGEMRLYKAPEEVEILKKACSATAEAHRAIIKEVKPGMNEYDIDSLITFEFRKRGCERVGYSNIVAGGVNATCLHYHANNQILKEGQLLLIDAGGEYQYYTADITRTFPIGKTMTEQQGHLYDLVLKSQIEAISMARPGATLPKIHKKVCDVLIEGLLSLGLLKGTPEQMFNSGEFKRFFPHNTSHFLGMDVHDVGMYHLNGEPRKLEAGMVFTIEPGLYTQPLDKNVPASYRDIGIRIEDDILITTEGHQVLTHAAPKLRNELEALKSV